MPEKSARLAVSALVTMDTSAELRAVAGRITVKSWVEWKMNVQSTFSAIAAPRQGCVCIKGHSRALKGSYPVSAKSNYNARPC